MDDPMMTIREIASTLKLAEKTVYAMASDGDLPAFKIRGQWRVRRTDFEAWLSRQARMPQVNSASNEPTASAAAVTNELAAPLMTEAATSLHPAERAVEDLTERVTQAEMHHRLVRALGSSNVRSHSPWVFRHELIAGL